MADIKLGISGSEVTLPIMQHLGGIPDESITFNKEIIKSVMSDGTPTYSVFQIKREIHLEWGILTYAEFQVLEGLFELNQDLRYQDNRESATWYNVIMLSFTEIKRRSISSATNAWYGAGMVLGEL